MNQNNSHRAYFKAFEKFIIEELREQIEIERTQILHNEITLCEDINFMLNLLKSKLDAMTFVEFTTLMDNYLTRNMPENFFELYLQFIVKKSEEEFDRNQNMI